MQQSPITDRTLGIVSCEKFRDVRARAKEEEENFRHKSKKSQEEPNPKFKIDDKVVLAFGEVRTKKRHYVFTQIIDCEQSNVWKKEFSYFGIVLKVTNMKQICRLGKLLKFNEERNSFGSDIIGTDDKKIKWIAQFDEEHNCIIDLLQKSS